MANIEDDVLFSSLRDKLFTAVVGDVLDKMGWRRQFLPQAIQPLKSDMKLVGRAMPVLEADVFDESPRSGAAGMKPFGLMLEALDDLRPHEVYVATGGSFRYALWGELMSTRARYLRAAGAVLNGLRPGCLRNRGARLSDVLPRTLCARPRPARQSDRLSHGRRNRGGPDFARRSDFRRSRGRPCHSLRGRSRGNRSGARESLHREQGRDRHSGRHGRARGVRNLWRPLMPQWDRGKASHERGPKLTTRRRA
jgi:Aldolase/RraA